MMTQEESWMLAKIRDVETIKIDIAAVEVLNDQDAQTRLEELGAQLDAVLSAPLEPAAEIPYVKRPDVPEPSVDAQ